MENRQYFGKTNDELPSNPQIITAKIKGEIFKFKTDNGVFSKDFLDYASKLLLENMTFSNLDSGVLDIGCGYGPIGIYVAKTTGARVVMCDVNDRALKLAEENLKLNNLCAEVKYSDCLDGLKGDHFSLIISNPPIHAGKEIIYKIFDQSYEFLVNNGELWVVMQYKHGAPSALKHLEGIFEKVTIVYKKKGFYLIKCQKTC